MEPHGGTSLSAKRCLVANLVSGFRHELHGGDENPPGNANQFWFDFDVLGVLDDSNRGKRLF